MVTVCPSPVEQICYLEYYYIFYPGYRVDLQAGEPNRNQKTGNNTACGILVLKTVIIALVKKGRRITGTLPPEYGQRQ